MKTFKKLFLVSTFLLLLFTSSAADASTIQSCGDVDVEIKGFGAGLMYQPRTIQIANQHLSVVSTSEKCAVVEWSTDIPATSQIVFNDFGENGSIHALNSEKENFGYLHASPQNNSAYVYHRAILPNLEAGKAYAYRVVSRDYPGGTPSVSEERVLIIPAVTTVAVVPDDNTPAPVVSESNTTIAGTVNYITKPVVETVSYEITKTIVVEDEEPAVDEDEDFSALATTTLASSDTATTTNSDSQIISNAIHASSSKNLASVPSALNAVANTVDTNNESSSMFWERLKRAFPFFFGVGGADGKEDDVEKTNEVESPSVVSPTVGLDEDKLSPIAKVKNIFNGDNAEDSKEKLQEPAAAEELVKAEREKEKATTTIDMASFLARTSFLVPTAFLLLFVFLMQQIVLPMVGVIVERPIIFCMFSVILFAIAAGILGFYQVTLVMIALFLGLLAYYLLKTASDEVASSDDIEDADISEAQSSLAGKM